MSNHNPLIEGFRRGIRGRSDTVPFLEVPTLNPTPAQLAECYEVPCKTVRRWISAKLPVSDPEALVLEAAELRGQIGEPVLRLLDDAHRQRVARRIQAILS